MKKIDAILLQLEKDNRKLRTCMDKGLWETAEELEKAVGAHIDRLFEMKAPFSALVLDAANLRRRFAIYNKDIDEATIHLGFVGSTCQGTREMSTQYADCLEATARLALMMKDVDLLAGSLHKCSDIRTKVLGPNHSETIRAKYEWVRFQQIMHGPHKRSVREARRRSRQKS